jgi:hypothetical protein
VNCPDDTIASATPFDALPVVSAAALGDSGRVIDQAIGGVERDRLAVEPVPERHEEGRGAVRRIQQEQRLRCGRTVARDADQLPGRISGRITGVADAVAVQVLRARIREQRAVVGGIADAIVVGVRVEWIHALADLDEVAAAIGN